MVPQPVRRARAVRAGDMTEGTQKAQAGHKKHEQTHYNSLCLMCVLLVLFVFPSSVELPLFYSIDWKKQHDDVQKQAVPDEG